MALCGNGFQVHSQAAWPVADAEAQSSAARVHLMANVHVACTTCSGIHRHRGESDAASRHDLLSKP